LLKKTKVNKKSFAATFKEKLIKLLNLKPKLLVNKKILVDKKRKKKSNYYYVAYAEDAITIINTSI